MPKFYKVTMFIEVNEDHIENDAILDYHIKDTLESSEAINNVDIEYSTEIEEDDSPY